VTAAIEGGPDTQRPRIDLLRGPVGWHGAFAFMPLHAEIQSALTT
jgi:hypothetical protein